MTEIPEHLLKRSKDRRAAAGDGTAGGADAAVVPAKAESSVPAVASKAAAPARKAAPAAPPPPKPDPPYIAAAKSRKKVPFWAMATLSLLPVWGFMYVQGVKPDAKEVGGPLGDGAEVYSSCSSCHGAAGGGGVGRPLNEGVLFKTFPHFEDQLNLIYTGSQAYIDIGIPYGDPAVGHLGYNGAVMPAQGTGLSEAQILAVACHERYTLGGVSPTDPEWAEEFEKWCAEDSEIYLGLEDGSLTFENLHEEIEDTLLVGVEARPGLGAGDEAPLSAG